MDKNPISNDSLAQELAKAYKVLREYESILNIMPDIIYKIDPEGHFAYLSNSVSMLGFKPEELLGKHFTVLVHPEDVENISREYVLPKFRGKETGEENAPKLFNELRTGRRITKNLAVRLVPKHARKDLATGNLQTIEGEVIASGIYGKLADDRNEKFEGTSGRIALKSETGGIGETSGGQTTHFDKKDMDSTQRGDRFEGSFGVIRDITEHKLLAEKKRQLEQQLFHSNKMQTIGELTGGIAHDFNNLLSIMLGQTEMILTKFSSLNQSLTHSVSTIHKTILQAADLNSKLLTFARKVKVVDLPVNLHEIITDTIQLLFHSFDKSFNLHKELTDSQPTIIGDVSLLKNAFINIAFNARDAMTGGGDLTFRTDIVDGKTLKKSFPDRIVPAGDYVAVAIQDTGTGMDQEVLVRIFEPFYTTKKLGKGTGLGLACVDGIVEMHKGFIEVESTKGVGSTFTIYLPLVKEAIPIQTSDDSEGQTPQWAREHIMIIDDEEVVLETQALLLVELGYRVSSFADPSLAVEYYSRHHDDVDLVILDLNMPVMNGSRCYQELKKIRHDVPVLISTGGNIENESEKLLKSGVVGIIQKPFPIKKLRQTITKILKKSPSSK